MIIHNVEQKSDAWHMLRKGKMTGTKATAVANAIDEKVDKKTGEITEVIGAGIKTLCKKLAAEHISEGISMEEFRTAQMEHGNDFEEWAIASYEQMRGVQSDIIGFVEIDKFTGFSPDRFVGKEGILEIKCPDKAGFMEYLLYGENAISSTYMWQIQFMLGLSDTNNKWCDFIVYNHDFINFCGDILVFRVLPDPAKINRIKRGLEVGKSLIEEYVATASKNKVKYL